MNKSTVNINSALQKLTFSIAAAKRSGLLIATTFQNEFFCFSLFGKSINESMLRTIDLESDEQSALIQLDTLNQNVLAITPSSQAFDEGVE